MVHETECRHVAVPRGKQDQTVYSTEIRTSDFIRFAMGSQCRLFFSLQEMYRVVVKGSQENESCSKVLNFLEKLEHRITCTHKETFAVVNRERIREVTRVLAVSSVRNLRIELMRLRSK